MDHTKIQLPTQPSRHLSIPLSMWRGHKEQPSIRAAMLHMVVFLQTTRNHSEHLRMRQNKHLFFREVLRRRQIDAGKMMHTTQFWGIENPPTSVWENYCGSSIQTLYRGDVHVCFKKKKKKEAHCVLCVYSNVYFCTLWVDIIWHDDRRPFLQSGGLLYVRGKKESICMLHLCLVRIPVCQCVFPNSQYSCGFIYRWI